MQSRKDAALRKIVEDERLPLKTRREALAEMDAPSRAFLTTLANGLSVPAKLRLDVARRLPGAEQRISDERMARAHRRSEPDEEARRREIDRILAECAREQDAQVEGPKTIPESTEARTAEPPPAPPSVPVDGVSSVPASCPEAVPHPVPHPNESGKRTDDGSETKRDELLAQGRELAAAIFTQLGIMSNAPLHWHAGQKRLEQLQGDFLAWERAMHADYPDLDLHKEFPDAQLRPPPPK